MSWSLANELTWATVSRSLLTLYGFSQYIYAHIWILTMFILFATLPGDCGVWHGKFRCWFVFVWVAYHLDKMYPFLLSFRNKPKSLSLSGFGSSSLFLYSLAFGFGLLLESNSFSFLSSSFLFFYPLAFGFGLLFESNSLGLLSSFSFCLYPLTFKFSLTFESDSFGLLSSFSLLF